MDNRANPILRGARLYRRTSLLTSRLALGNVFAPGDVDPGLVALAVRRMGLEPIDEIGIEAQGKLLFDRAKLSFSKFCVFRSLRF